MSRCSRSLGDISRLTVPTGGAVDVDIGADVTRFLLRVTDPASSNAPAAFAVRKRGSGTQLFHFAAGEAWTVEDLKLDQDLELTVEAVAALVVELLPWHD